MSTGLTFLVLVCGGRQYKDIARLTEVMEDHHKRHCFSHLMEGGAPGADQLAHLWAMTKPEIQTLRAFANWNLHGTRAGFIRNKAMIALSPDLVIAFPGGNGTAHTVGLAKTNKIPLIKVK